MKSIASNKKTWDSAMNAKHCIRENQNTLWFSLSSKSGHEVKTMIRLLDAGEENKTINKDVDFFHALDLGFFKHRGKIVKFTNSHIKIRLAQTIRTKQTLYLANETYWFPLSKILHLRFVCNTK
jgi:hypothetical protein